MFVQMRPSGITPLAKKGKKLTWWSQDLTLGSLTPGAKLNKIHIFTQTRTGREKFFGSLIWFCFP